MSIIMFTIAKNSNCFCYIVAVCYSSIKRHKLKTRVELKERKTLEIRSVLGVNGPEFLLIQEMISSPSPNP